MSLFPFIITVNFMFQILLTTRNVLIANLAFTDLVLCIIAMPLYLADFIFKYWPLRVDMVRAEFYRKEKKEFIEILNFLEIFEIS